MTPAPAPILAMRLLAGDASDEAVDTQARALGLETLVARALPHRAAIRAIWRAAPHTPDLAATRALFERAAALSPDLASCLYGLGDPALVSATAAEIAGFLSARGLLGAHRRVLDLGCGAGRVLAALGPQVGFALGLDISQAMIAAAQKRAPKAAFARISGRDLSIVADGAFDLALAIDSFPYLAALDPPRTIPMTREIARALKPGGVFVAMNWTYGENAQADARAAAQASGLALVEAGLRPFALWDGAVFLFAKS